MTSVSKWIATGLAIAVAMISASAAAQQEMPRLLKKPATTAPTQPATPAQQVPDFNQIPLEERVPPPVEGIKCIGNRDCASGNCVEGVCCATTCAGKCRSCALPGHIGICTDVPDGQDPKRACTIAQGGHPACNAVCYSGRCTVPDVGTRCGVCAVCDGFGRCTRTPDDDEQCGVIECRGLDNHCRRYEDLQAVRCAALGMCKTPNDPATCIFYRNFYSGVDPNGVRRECGTGKIMNCYRFGTRWVWQDGSVIKDCQTGQVCAGCSSPFDKKPEEWAPPKPLDPDPE